MSKTVLILFAGCVGLSLLSLHLVKQMRDGDAKIAELQAQMAQLQRPPPAPSPAPQAFEPGPPVIESEPIASSPPAKETPKAAMTSRVAPAVQRPASAPVQPSPEERVHMMREQLEQQRQLMQDPEYRDAMRAQYRQGVSRQYPGLARELNLSPEETEALFNLLADQQMRANDNLPSAWDPAESDPAVVQQKQQKVHEHWQEVQRKNEAELAAHLGAHKMQAWKEYQTTLGARHEVDQLSNSLSGRGMPLDEEANRSVLKALAALQKAEQQEYAMQAKAAGSQGQAVAAIAFGPGMADMSSGQVDMYEKFLEQTKKRNQRMLEAISPYLTQEQREAVRKEREAQVKMQEAQMRIMRQRNSTNNASDVIGTETWISVPPQ